MKNQTKTDMPIQDPKTEIDELVYHLERIKGSIRDRRQRQAEIEERLVNLVGVKEEGTITHRTDRWRVSTTGGLTRSLEVHDPEVYRVKLGDRFDDLISIKLSIRTAALRKASLEEQAAVMEYMIVKPKRTAVKVEPREDF